MREKISRVALIVYVFLFLFAGFALSAPGGRVLLGILMGAFAMPAVIVGPRRYRIVGLIALVVAIVGTVADYKNGKRFRARLERTRAQVETQSKEQGGEQGAAPLPRAPAGHSERAP